MRHWILISFTLLTCSAIAYYAFYGRLHNKVEPRLNITYQTVPTARPVEAVNEVLIEPTQKISQGRGNCPDLPIKNDVHAMYVKSSAIDCGALNDNEMIMDEAETKNIMHCLQNSLQRKGSCGNSKAFIALQGFEGSVEVFIESKDCHLAIKQWSTTSPSCGYKEKTCDIISDKFPFEMCRN